MWIYSQIWESLKSIQIIPITRNKYKLTKGVDIFSCVVILKSPEYSGLCGIISFTSLNFSFSLKFTVCFLSMIFQTY